MTQFDFADAPTAASFIDDLILVSHQELNAGLNAVIQSLLATSSRPLALFAVRESDSRPYFDQHNRSQRPSAVAEGGKVGSEGPIANLLRDIARQHGPGKALDHPHIESMRGTKVRWLVVVDDIIGSGLRMKKFIRWMSRDRTIKSWLSYGYVRFVAVCFAATPQGKAIVETAKYVSAVHSNRVAEEGRVNWTDRERDKYVDLCRRYASRTSRSWWPLGFESAMTMLVFQHKCPNTTPAIIWAASKDWHALIGSRPEFALEEWPNTPDDAERIKKVLASLEEPNPSEVQWMKFVAPESRMRFLLLAVLSKRRLDSDLLSAVICTSKADCDKLLRECRRFGWITLDNRMTERGWAELQHARRLGLVSHHVVALTDDIYVPQSFRGASG